ncbi:HD domain-containing protein [Actinoplanes sp. NBRC 103695]|uniref:HD domain-containing protein n=1 Tax=Actinoplanes sp. NBRC 103695 TaxID=3032202 RepID=UPI00331F622B
MVARGRTRLPERSRDMVRDPVDEYESRQTPEAQCARDADKREMLLQAVEYRDIGVLRVEGRIESHARASGPKPASASRRPRSSCRP